MFVKKTVRDVPLAGKVVLLRADYNVPLQSNGKIADDFRVLQSLPTLRFLQEQDCKVVIISHLGRPDGRAVQKYSLEPVAWHLSDLLGLEVQFVGECVGDKVSRAVAAMKPGSVALLENLRFHPGEESNDKVFAKRLAQDTKAQYFVQDAFGTAHRAHASTDAITHLLPSVAGLLLEKEYATITEAMESPKRPLVAVLGGAKVSDKIEVIERFIDIADRIVIGGAMANTFLKFYGGYEIGKSVHDKEAADMVAHLMRKVCDKWCQKEGVCQCESCEDCSRGFLLPVDAAVAQEIDETAERQDVGLSEVQPDQYILDLGANSIGRMIKAFEGAGMIVWNGTLGYAELSQFAFASNFAAGTMASHRKIKSIVGGGDTADFVLGWARQQGKDPAACFDHISTGGGASLDLMAGKKLPAVEALLDA